MPETTLTLKYSDLKMEVGFFLGYGRGVDFGDRAWTTRQAAAIETCIRSGLRQFYQPPAVDGFAAGYDWSFMKPTTTVQFLQGTSFTAMPDDFGGIEGQLSFQSGGSSVYCMVAITGEGVVREKYAIQPDTTGKTIVVAIRPVKGTTTSKSQQFQLYFWPIADQDYTVGLTYYVNPDALTNGFPFHMGGMEHSETLLESCLSVAEQRLDDSAQVHTMKFQERLIASINYDRRKKPQLVGYNGDKSDLMGRQFGRRY